MQLRFPHRLQFIDFEKTSKDEFFPYALRRSNFLEKLIATIKTTYDDAKMSPAAFR